MLSQNTIIPKSAKRLAREAKLAKKQSQQRTMEERSIEVEKIFSKLQELGITRETVGEFNEIAKDYVEFGYSASGVITMPEIHRELIYLLSNDKKHDVATMLRAI